MARDYLFVIGGSSDIAGALLEKYLADRPDRSAVALSRSESERLAALQERFPGRLSTVTCDLADSNAVADCVGSVREQHGVPSAIVPFAGSKLRLERFAKWDAAHVELDMRIQVLAVAQIMRGLLPEMARASARTKVVFVLSSVTHGVPPKYMSMYVVTKFAQWGLMRALAAEYSGTSVCVNAVCPRMVRTKFLADLPEKAVEMAASKAPAGRLLSPGTVADAIAFLLSPAANHVHGAELLVTDGEVF
jgi:3-oxoacyl-[acyl-carrier protein] reductase